MPAIYSKWTQTTPRTDSNAHVTRHRSVRNITVIEVSGARYRDSQPLADVFELVNQQRDPRKWRGALRVEVYCAWHGVQPPTCYPNIEIFPKKYRIIESYTGKVADNISS